MKIRSFIFSILVLLIVASAQASTPGGVLYQHTLTPLVQPYFGTNGHAIVGARSEPGFDVHNDFASGFRSDVISQSGTGHYDDEQSGFYAYNANVVVPSRGNGLAYWGYVENLGKGNGLFGASNVTCYGGGEVWQGPGSTPECAALGEYAAIQGTKVWSATVSGSPAPGTTTMHYAGSVNDDILGERYLLNLNHTYTTGTFQSVSGLDITFAGTAFTTALSSGTWYLKIGSTREYYTGTCNGDDVKTDGTHCIGHWYRVLSVTDDTHLHMAGVFDNVHLISTPGSSIMLIQGTEIQGFNKTARTLTIPSNTFAWTDGDTLISPPTSFQFFDGLQLIFEKQFKTGVPSAPSEGLMLTSIGPAAMDRAIHIGPKGAPGDPGGYFDGIYVDAPITRSVLEVAQDVPYPILLRTASTRFNNGIVLGTSGQATINYVDLSTTPIYNPQIKFEGAALGIVVGIAGDQTGVKHLHAAGVGCTTAASVGATCTSSAIPWDGAPFVDTNYTLTCTPEALTGVPVITSVSKSTGTFTITIAALTAVGASANFDCLAVHS